MVSDSKVANFFFFSEFVTLIGLFGSRLEAIIFCPAQVAWLLVSLDPLSQSHREPEEIHKSPEHSRDAQEGLTTSWALFPKYSRTAMRASALPLP